MVCSHSFWLWAVVNLSGGVHSFSSYNNLLWTRDDFHDDAAIVGEERKGMKLAVSLSLFASRVQQIRVPLQEHHDLLLLATLPVVESALHKGLKVIIFTNFCGILRLIQ